MADNRTIKSIEAEASPTRYSDHLWERLQPRSIYSRTLANVDSDLAWLNADIAPGVLANTNACGIGISATCCAVLEPMRSSRGGMPKYSR
jgi:hypothetical protein